MNATPSITDSQNRPHRELAAFTPDTKSPDKQGIPSRTQRPPLPATVTPRPARESALATGYGLLMAVIGLLTNGYFLGFMHGAVTVTFVSMILVAFHAATGSIWQLAGAWGEDNTRDVLRWATRHRLIYGWIDNVEVQGGDVDHLVATSTGWIALDSKWHSRSLDREVIRHDAERATKAARIAESILRSIKHHAAVRPVAVLWGGTRDEVPDSYGVAHNVEFVSGSHLKRWLRELPSGEMDSELANVVLQKLREFRQTVRPADRSLLDRGR